MLLIRRGFFRLGIVYFDESVDDALSPDLVEFYHQPAPHPEVTSMARHTLQTDLRQPADAVFGAFEKDTRYEINRALARDGLTEEHWFRDSPLVMDAFHAEYAAFLREKALPAYRSNRLRLFAAGGRADVSRMCDCQGAVLCWHVYYRTEEHVRLLHSVSRLGAAAPAARQLIGRANRALHWRDMLRFQAEGIATYDWGGWYEGRDDPHRLQINKFKQEFGGKPVVYFDYVLPCTMRGRAFVLLRRIARREAA
jgi:hypothetical protein